MPVTKKSIKKSVRISDKAKKVRPIVIVSASGAQVKAFMEFIRTQGVIGLAVGLVLGGAVSILVKSLVDNVIMPPLGLLLGSAEGLKGLTWTMGITTAGKPATLQYGVFLNDFINFVVIALVIYALVRLLKVDKLDKK
ncbi:MAG: MscL family protein [Candidatus Saccharimonadales bacterium]